MEMETSELLVIVLCVQAGIFGGIVTLAWEVAKTKVEVRKLKSELDDDNRG